MASKRPRLESEVYVGLQRYFLTFCTAARRNWFVDPEHVDPVREQILQTAPDLDVEIIAYGFKPDTSIC
jgi:REP element-mobilizing transposase RayT